jgi:glycosyltransferase involved in cell wall biosynthesis
MTIFVSDKRNTHLENDCAAKSRHGEAMPTVSIIVPLYNAERFVTETIDSIRAQTYGDLEIICVDDRSTDRSADIAEGYGGVRVLRREQNSGGASVPRNDGIAVASGDYIALCDADDLMMPEKIAAQVAFLEEHPDIDFCFTDFVDFDGAGPRSPHIASCVNFVHAIDRAGSNSAEYVVSSESAQRLLVDENFVGASSMLFRRRLIGRVGAFRPELLGAEDLDFVFRVAADGPIGFVDIVGHKRRLHDSNVCLNQVKLLTNHVRMLRDRFEAVRDQELRDRLALRVGYVYQSLAYLLRKNGAYRSSLRSAFLAVWWSPTRVAACVEVLKSLVAPLHDAVTTRK